MIVGVSVVVRTSSVVVTDVSITLVEVTIRVKKNVVVSRVY